MLLYAIENIKTNLKPKEILSLGETEREGIQAAITTLCWGLTRCQHVATVTLSGCLLHQKVTNCTMENRDGKVCGAFNTHINYPLWTKTFLTNMLFSPHPEKDFFLALTYNIYYNITNQSHQRRKWRKGFWELLRTTQSQFWWKAVFQLCVSAVGPSGRPHCKMFRGSYTGCSANKLETQPWLCRLHQLSINTIDSVNKTVADDGDGGRVCMHSHVYMQVWMVVYVHG